LSVIVSIYYTDKKDSKYFLQKIYKKNYAVMFFNKKWFLLHYGLNTLFQKTKKKVRQENGKWTFLKCPK